MLVYSGDYNNDLEPDRRDTDTYPNKLVLESNITLVQESKLPYDIWFLTSYHSKKHEKHPGTMAHNTVGLGTQLDTFRWC